MEGENRLEAALHSGTLEKNSLSNDANRDHLMEISCAAAELVPTRQYANITVGPIVIKRMVPIDFDGFTESEINSMKKAIKEIQVLCEEAVADDRSTVHNMIRQSEQGRLIP